MLINVFFERTRGVDKRNLCTYKRCFFFKERRQNGNLFSLPRMLYFSKKPLINKNQVAENLTVSLEEKGTTYMISSQWKKGNEIKMMGCSSSFTIAGDCRRYTSDTNVLCPPHSLWQVYYQ